MWHFIIPLLSKHRGPIIKRVEYGSLARQKMVYDRQVWVVTKTTYLWNEQFKGNVTMVLKTKIKYNKRKEIIHNDVTKRRGKAITTMK